MEGIRFGVLSCTVALTTQANAACYDTGIPAFANSQRASELCIGDTCEDALLMRSCGNVHYASLDYNTDTTQWLFRVRLHQKGSTDDEFAVLQNGEGVPSSDTANIKCEAEPGSGDCTFVDKILSRDCSE